MGPAGRPFSLQVFGDQGCPPSPLLPAPYICLPGSPASRHIEWASPVCGVGHGPRPLQTWSPHGAAAGPSQQLPTLLAWPAPAGHVAMQRWDQTVVPPALWPMAHLGWRGPHPNPPPPRGPGKEATGGEGGNGGCRGAQLPGAPEPHHQSVASSGLRASRDRASPPARVPGARSTHQVGALRVPIQRGLGPVSGPALAKLVPIFLTFQPQSGPGLRQSFALRPSLKCWRGGHPPKLSWFPGDSGGVRHTHFSRMGSVCQARMARGTPGC